MGGYRRLCVFWQERAPDFASVVCIVASCIFLSLCLFSQHRTNPKPLHYQDKPFAIVDVETTGASAIYSRIIEIAVIRVKNGKITHKFESLVNPERFIPFSVEQLTGISNLDVAGAPLFGDIAGELFRLLDGAIFVAHNARFDYGFVKNEFRRLGKSFNARCLCTVKLSRRLFPQYRNHDLSSVINRFGIVCDDRHRAMGDVKATYEFLKMAQVAQPPDLFDEVVNKLLKTSVVPSNVDQQAVESLPESCGVYLLHGKDGELLYVGKSVNIRERVRSHFSSDHTSSREMKMCQQVHRVEARTTAGELGALLLESKLIKELRPIYNVAARRHRDIVIARKSVTMGGYSSVQLEEIDYIKRGDAASILAIFKHMKQGREYLDRISKEHRLCQKLIGLQRTNSYCFAYHLHQCNGACVGEEDPVIYNARVEMAFAERRIKAWPYNGAILIEERDEFTGDGEVFLVDQWCLVSSFRYAEHGYQLKISGPHRFDYDAYKIISRYVLNRANTKKIKLLSHDQMRALVGEEYHPQSAEM
jgi:DNA polymerase-3 subunit epsilon